MTVRVIAKGERVQATRVASALDLLRGSEASLVEAGHAAHVAQRYAGAHLAALRAAAAVLAVRGPRLAGSRGSGGPRHLWELLPAVAPELHEWADFFALSSARRARPDEAISSREADDLVRSAQEFHDRVRVLLGLTRRSGPLLLSPIAVH